MARSTDPLSVLKLNRANALELSQTIGVKKVRKLLAQAQAELQQRLAQVEGLGGAGKDSFTAAKLEVSLRQVQDVTRTLNKGMKRTLLGQADTAADTATGDLVDYMQAQHRVFTGIADMPLPLREMGVLDRAQQGARASILRRLASSGEPDAAPENAEGSPARVGILDRYGMNTVELFEQKLQMGLLTGESWASIRAGITEASPFLQEQPAFWAERIVRTETMGAYNRAGWEAMRATDDVLGDMTKILSATFDERTGWDSFQVHGQIRLVDQAFQWADGAYQHPPNRPNDREVVVPHRIAWPLPPYLKWRTDEEVLNRYKMQRKTGSPGERPEMTTVPLSRFGRG